MKLTVAAVGFFSLSDVYSTTPSQDVSLKWTPGNKIRLGIIMASSFIILQNSVVILMSTLISAIRKKNYIFFILCLSVGDLLFGISTMTSMVTMLFAESYSTQMCTFLNIIFHSSLTISLVQFNTICLERFLQVYKFPSKSKFFNKKRRYIWIFSTWLSCVIGVTSLVNFGKKSQIRKITKCPEGFIENGKMINLVTNSLYMILFSTNIILFCLLSREILRKLKKVMQQPTKTMPKLFYSRTKENNFLDCGLTGIKSSHETLPSATPAAKTSSSLVSITSVDFHIRPRSPAIFTFQQHNAFKSIKDSYISVSLLMFMFIFCYGPAIIRRQIDFFSPNPLNESTNLMSLVLIGLNALLNPVFYVWRLKEFRQNIPFRRRSNAVQHMKY